MFRFEPGIKVFYKTLLTIYHVFGVMMVLATSPTATEAGKHVWPYVPSIPFQVLAGPIKVAIILSPAVPQFPRLNRLKFFLLHILCVEILCGALVGTQVYYYCTLKIRKCYEPEYFRNLNHEDYSMTDLSLQTIVTIYTCCIICLLKSVSRIAIYCIRKAFDWLKDYSLSILIWVHSVVIVLDMDYNRSSFSFLVLNIVCDTIVTHYPPLPIDRANFWLEVHRHEMQLREQPHQVPNGWIINRYEDEPGEEPRAGGWFADRDGQEAGEGHGVNEEFDEHVHDNMQEMLQMVNEEIRDDRHAENPIQVHEE